MDVGDPACVVCILDIWLEEIVNSGSCCYTTPDLWSAILMYKRD